MASEFDKVSLNTLCGGGVVERFDDELRNVIKNIKDPNTSDKVREITLKVKIKVNDARDYCAVVADISSKTLPPKPITTSMFIGIDPKDGPVAYEHKLVQMEMYAQQNAGEAGKVTTLSSVNGGKQ